MRTINLYPQGDIMLKKTLVAIFAVTFLAGIVYRVRSEA